MDGEWITSHHLQIPRYAHTSWTTSDGTLLIGGLGEMNHFSNSTELVKTNGTTEVGALQLKYESSYVLDIVNKINM